MIVVTLQVSQHESRPLSLGLQDTAMAAKATAPESMIQLLTAV